jgi:hypothetical protein
MVECESAVDLNTGEPMDPESIHGIISLDQIRDAFDAYRWFESV